MVLLILFVLIFLVVCLKCLMLCFILEYYNVNFKLNVVGFVWMLCVFFIMIVCLYFLVLVLIIFVNVCKFFCKILFVCFNR